jgi:hypothetical protein
MKPDLVAGALLALCASVAAAQDQSRSASDYPTIERVQFVEACVREHPDRQRQEMIYKCSCAMDKIIAQLTYDEYVEASTAYFAGQTAGERGAGLRESSVGQTLSERYRSVHRTALKDCLIAE